MTEGNIEYFNLVQPIQITTGQLYYVPFLFTAPEQF